MKCFSDKRANPKLYVLPLLVVLLAGCVSGPERPAPPVGKRIPLVDSEQAERMGWWPVCFRMPFDEGGKPRWEVDLLLADQVVGPLLLEYEQSIALWRFHRRARNDSAGHQLTVLVYTDDITAAAITGAAQSAPEVMALRSSGYLREVVDTCRGETGQPAVGAHSDPTWDERLQETWPYFIMGVSAHWLAQIDEVSRGQDEVPAAIEPMLAHYRAVQEEVTRIWRKQGQHAYMHHLNAIFGYEPVLIKRYLRF